MPMRNDMPLSLSPQTTYHLGNIRQVTMDDGASKGTVIQKMNYYPFGAEFCDLNRVSYVQNHKYNGKEFDNMHGLNTYDYGARQHDPILARWDRIDPLCEKYYSTSPYAYCVNNPIIMIDPDGKEVRDGTGPYNAKNASLKALARNLAAHNDPNSIMICAHGVYNNESDRFASSINIQTYNTNSGKWTDNYISNGQQLNEFLTANSQTWNDYKAGKISADDLHIVFYSCGSAPVVQEISKDEAFKDVTFIAPNKEVQVMTDSKGNLYTSVENTKWEKVRMGKL
jgi:RHS repeat-associated protein